MRIVVVAMLACAATARADSKAEVEALIKKNLETIRASDWTSFDTTFRSDGYYLLPNDGMVKLAEYFYSAHVFNIRQKVERMTVVVDDATHVAWFHVDFSATYQLAMVDENGKTPWFDRRTRMVGIAIDEGGWKLAAAMYSTAFADKYLYKDVRELEKPDPDHAAGRAHLGGVRAAMVHQGPAARHGKGHRRGQRHRGG